METKKNPQYDVNGQRPFFLSLGLCLSLMFCITAFNWKDYGEKDLPTVTLEASMEDDEIIENTVIEKKQKPPQPIQQPKIEIVSEEEELPEIEVDFEVDFEEDDVVEEVEFVDEGDEEAEEAPFDIVEHQADFPGGIGKFYKFVKKNLKYPSQARRMGTEGKVYIQFVVERDGSLTNIKVMKPIGGGCDEEAIRVLKSSPRWNPGKQRGRPVRVRRVIPIVFKLS
ncbi:protein TonB (plasmid) [Fulvitalea axinellae]|uniref:Protein TonB n=1 Tax=Fulvitalea axinellae TaxID=1182444 RepID=A0AAU9DAK6_9BACT|nr:protein TonB [Fulvitalea axinellae]